MADLGSLDAPTLALLEEMTGAVAARGETTLIPGLFRHLAQYPGLLALAWTALRPSVEGRALARTANAVARQATGLAVALPPPGRSDARSRDEISAAPLHGDDPAHDRRRSRAERHARCKPYPAPLDDRSVIDR